VDAVLAEIGAEQIPQILVYNKTTAAARAANRSRCERPGDGGVDFRREAPRPDLLADAVAERLTASPARPGSGSRASAGAVRSRLYAAKAVRDEHSRKTVPWDARGGAADVELLALARTPGVHVLEVQKGVSRHLPCASGTSYLQSRSFRGLSTPHNCFSYGVNQPGQNNPWGGRRPGGQGNGPDLDERVKALAAPARIVFRPVAGAARAARCSFSWPSWRSRSGGQRHLPDQGSRARRDFAFGQLVTSATRGRAGVWPLPIETLIKVNVASVEVERVQVAGADLDVNLVDLRFAVQYQLSDPKKVLLKVKDPVSTLSEVARWRIREWSAAASSDNVLRRQDAPGDHAAREGSSSSTRSIPTTPASRSPL